MPPLFARSRAFSCMYLDYFGLSRFPFTIAPDPEFLFPSPGHQEALAHLHYAFTGHGGLICLTGEVGTGKTTLCRAFLGSAPQEVRTAYIFNPQLSALELLQNICDELGIAYTKSASQKEVYSALNSALLEFYAAGQRVICVIDEAQSMPVPLLEQIRLLTNLETDKEKLLTLILVGQPELRELLGRYELRQLNQRITARYHLRNLSETETRAYLRHRLATAGCDLPVFSETAGKLIWKGSAGVPRIINSVADRALLGAYASSQKTVSVAIARQALREVLGDASAVVFQGPGAPMSWIQGVWGGMSGVLVALVLVALGVIAAPRLSQWWQPPSSMQLSGEQQPAVLASTPQLAGVSGLTGLAETTDAEQQNLSALRAALSEPAVANKQDPVLLLEQSLGLTPATCDELPDQGWECLWIAWPRNQLDDFQYQVAVMDYRGEWQLLSQAADKDLRQRALLLWQPPQGYDSLVRPGQTSPVIAWVRAVLGVEWHGDWQVIGPKGQAASMAEADQTYYDPLLSVRVAEFQARNGLDADRILGPQTLLYLQKQLVAEPPAADTSVSAAGK
jgi:general secretion pathway protein A